MESRDVCRVAIRGLQCRRCGSAGGLDDGGGGADARLGVPAQLIGGLFSVGEGVAYDVETLLAFREREKKPVGEGGEK